MIAAKGSTIAFLDEGAASPKHMETSEALSAAVSIAAFVNTKKEEFAISFTSLFIGLVAVPDATGEWLRKQFERSQADLYNLLRRRGVGIEELDKLVEMAAKAPEQSSQSKRPFTRTGSARQALDEAERLAQAASQVTDTLHVVAAFLSLPGFHERDFKELGIDRNSWKDDLKVLMPSSSPSDKETADDFNPHAAGIEAHVTSALKHANALAGSEPIGPSHVVKAVVGLSKSTNSAAFKRLAQLVPLSPDSALSAPSEVPDAKRFEEDLRRQLLRAQRSSPESREGSSIWGRDLVTAALLCAEDRVGPIVATAGRSLDMVRDLWYAFVTADSKHRPKTEWAAWWRGANVSLPGPRRAGYTTETDQGDDKLGVDAEARAFARLILDKSVQAPLSIGLLGDWGSGKSFFIEQIKKGIAELKDEGRPELYNRVVEIEFNAWHASDANLWASLVTNIFDAIWEKVSPADETRDPKVARARLQKQIEQARGAVHEAETQVALGQQALEMAEQDLKQKREILAWNKYAESISTEKLKDLAKSAGWHQSIETINDVEDALRSLADSGNRLRCLVSALLEKPITNIALPTAVLISATVAIWLLVDVSAFQALTKNLTKALSTVAGLAGAIVVPLRLARQKVDGLTKTLDKINTEYDKKLAEVKESDEKGTEAVVRARRELESAEASVNAARARLGELLNQQATLDPRRRLGAFLQERVQSTQYRSQQGIISLVHKDFSELSKYMKDLRESMTVEGAPSADEGAIRPFDRIVIYVDDLDRCRPAHVVNMLEAVHLLLALDLFVVVVAVDSRWLTRALEVYYHDLLTASDGKEGDGLRASTPQSYLEKIFQITYALGPMNPKRFGDYVAFLSGEEAERKEPAKTATGTKPDTSATTGKTQQTLSDEKGDEKGLPNAVKTETPSGDKAGLEDQHIPAAKSVRPASPPVRIGKDEREFIERLVPLLPTPRIAKRLVNVYRVIKARMSAEELESFEREGRDRTCLLMLAILFGSPGIAALLLRAIHERKPPFDKPDEPLVTALKKHQPPNGEPSGTRDAWARLVNALESIGITESVGNCAREPQEVARYSLVSGHDWHTWKDPLSTKGSIGPAAGMADGQKA